MRLSTLAVFIVVAGTPGFAVAQQAAPSQNLQNEADKGIKTQNSGASGYVADEQRPGSANHAPGEPNRADNSTATAPSAQNSGAGISGAPGNKNGPAANKGTVGSANENNLSVQEQDPANVKGMPGNKSGPPAKR